MMSLPFSSSVCFLTGITGAKQVPESKIVCSNDTGYRLYKHQTLPASPPVRCCQERTHRTLRFSEKFGASKSRSVLQIQSSANGSKLLICFIAIFSMKNPPDFRYRPAFLPQRFDIGDTLHRLFPRIPARQFLILLFKGEKALFCVKLQGTVPSFRQSYQFSNGDIFGGQYGFHAPLS